MHCNKLCHSMTSSARMPWGDRSDHDAPPDLSRKLACPGTVPPGTARRGATWLNVTMGYHWQARIILAFGALFFVCAAYNLYVLVGWNVRTIEAKGTITAIEGYSAESKPGPRSACRQTLHYRFIMLDGKTYRGKDGVWWGDCRLHTGAPLIVYFDRNDPSQSITSIGFKSRRGWVGLLVLWTFAALIGAVAAQACDDWRAILDDTG
jgi:Protein of unknown function (DUF3592)